MMKKRWIFTGLAVACAVSVGLWSRSTQTVPTVRTKVLSPTSVEQTVSCNGVVEAVDGVGVFAPVACYIREVSVTAGQRVKKGDVLAVVDKEMTLAGVEDVEMRFVLAGMKEELVATDDGVVVEVSAESGKVLPLGTPCALLVRSCDLRVRIAIREKDLRLVREGMRVRISGDGLDQSVYNGELTEISCTASAGSSATVVAGLVCPDDGETDDSFRLGLTAKATVVVSVMEGGCLVPYEAVLSDEKGSYIYLMQDGVACRYGVDGAEQMTHGLLLTDTALVDASVILEPEKVAGDGCAVLEEKT